MEACAQEYYLPLICVGAVAVGSELSPFVSKKYQGILHFIIGIAKEYYTLKFGKQIQSNDNKADEGLDQIEDV